MECDLTPTSRSLLTPPWLLASFLQRLAPPKTDVHRKSPSPKQLLRALCAVLLLLSACSPFALSSSVVQGRECVVAMDVCEAVGMENQSEVEAPSVPELPPPVTACAADSSDSDLSELSAGSGSASAEVRSQGWQQPASRVQALGVVQLWLGPSTAPDRRGSHSSRGLTRAGESSVHGTVSASRHGPAGALGRPPAYLVTPGTSD